MKKHVLIVDDDPGIIKVLSKIVQSMGHQHGSARNLSDARSMIASAPWDVVLLDIDLPDGNGLEAIPQFKKGPSSPEVIILTGASTADNAEIAIKSGAWDYLEKPFLPHSIKLPLTRVFQFRDQKSLARTPMLFKRDKIVGSSQEIKACLELAAKAAGSDANVLITGETGTGKELFARAIHENSARARSPFVVVDCAALPETLVESLLFGHKKGAFTGANTDKDGLVKQAHGGTLFLDEVAEMPLANQQRFLRVLQERAFCPLGSSVTVKSDFRLIAATNRDVDAMVKAGSFREDLYFRLRSLAIPLPALKDRKGGVPDIALWAIRHFCEKNNLETMGFFPEFLEALVNYDWPGNVRELLSAIEVAVTNATEEMTLHPTHLPVHIRARIARSSVRKKSISPAGKNSQLDHVQTLPTMAAYRELCERQYLETVLQHTGENIHEACRLTGLSRAQIYRLLKKYGLKPGNL